MITVYFQNNWNWTDILAYAWTAEPKVENGTWPGVAMELVGLYDNQQLYAFTYDTNETNYVAIIFSGINDRNWRDQSPDISLTDKSFLATDCFYMLWDSANEKNTYGHCGMNEDSLHIHAAGAEYVKDADKHWYACSCGNVKYEEAAHEVAETVYENGYKVEKCVCGHEMSKEACLTYVVSNCNDASKNVTGHFELVDSVYAATITLAKWDHITLYYNGAHVNNSNATMLKGTAWAGGGWGGEVYPLYIDTGSTPNGFISATGGEYAIAYNVEENSILLGEAVAENTYAVQSTTGDSTLTVRATAGQVLKEGNTFPSTANGWRLFIVVDADGKIMFMCHSIANGFGIADDTYVRHSDYADESTNPALVIGNSWNVVVPEGGYAITAYGDNASALVQDILSNPNLQANDDYQAEINKISHNVDSVRVVYDAAAATVTITK